MSNVVVAGVGMIDFCKPGQQLGYRTMGSTAIQKALSNANLREDAIELAIGSYVYGDSTCAQHVLYDVVQSGIPVINVNNNCASGSTALYLAREMIESGSRDCVLVFGFEEMQPGAIASQWEDRESPFLRFERLLDSMNYPQGPLALRCFGAAGHHYLEVYGGTSELFAQIAVKNRQHALLNPHALFNQPLTIEDVLSQPPLYLDYLTRLMCCPPSCGAAAAILCSESFARRHNVDCSVRIRAQSMSTDMQDSWQSPIDLVGAAMTRRAMDNVVAQSGIDTTDVDVVELHDCFTTNEVISCEALGLCPEGGAAEFVSSGNNTYGGRCVVNPSGGLMSKGHPLGATGIAQCVELTSQLRHQCGNRQVSNPRLGLQHNVGLGGAVVVTLYERHGTH